ncbi:MRPS15 [Symbiodinium natans]|uniref:MRPS15 protein n=1 Tax=Symbiodinium natans TaxID=878477 RepID=A0A812Q6N6_9DINO|nr:MRPS15 [Symbiodinium natans]
MLQAALRLWSSLPKRSTTGAKSVQACAGPLYNDVRGIARVRINRYTGVKAVKMSPPKTEWQAAAEKEFLQMRASIPKDELLWHLTPDDVRHLSPEMRKCLTLRCASNRDVSKWRAHQLIRKFQRRPFDTNSHAVRIACLTEKILRLRAHLLRTDMGGPHQEAKESMRKCLTRRNRAMKVLYKVDYPLYKHTCQELGIRCIRYAIPMKSDPQTMINAQAVDGDHAKWLIRQRIYKAKFRPRELREPGSQRRIRWSRHPMEPVPASHGRPKATPQQVSTAWPYGVRQDRVEGKQVVYNPTAAGRGFQPAKMKIAGGRAQEPE